MSSTSCSMSPTPAVGCLSSTWSSTHRDLHSSPTRRSSDLVMVIRAVTDGSVKHQVLPAPSPWWGGLGSGKDLMLYRSEEHTSELQSHVNLVCRLLLEKKKRR